VSLLASCMGVFPREKQECQLEKAREGTQAQMEETKF